MNKKLIRLTESDLHKIVKESVDRILANASLIGKKKQVQNTPIEEMPQDHTYSEKEMQWLYDHQDELSPIQQKVLRAVMWWRARMANYHGYVKEWPNITVENGEIFYYDKGKFKKIPS